MDKINKNDLENLKKMFEEREPFTTGFMDLDDFLSGIQPKDIITIGARPAVGKTMFATAIVNYLLKEKKKVCYFSLEGTKEQVYLSFLADLTKIDVHKLHRSLNNKIVQIPQINKAMEVLSSRELYIKNKTMLTIEEFEEDVKTVKPDVVVIDYIQLLKMPKAPNLTEATNLAIHEVKRIAEENNVIVILISQLSRAVEARESKIPMLSDLRNGSLLEELSDVILFVHREDYYNPDIEEEERKRADIIIAKNKYGQVGSITLNYENGLFSERRTINVIDL